MVGKTHSNPAEAVYRVLERGGQPSGPDKSEGENGGEKTPENGQLSDSGVSSRRSPEPPKSPGLQSPEPRSIESRTSLIRLPILDPRPLFRAARPASALHAAGVIHAQRGRQKPWRSWPAKAQRLQKRSTGCPWQLLAASSVHRSCQNGVSCRLGGRQGRG
jgi:hypothetical protein